MGQYILIFIAVLLTASRAQTYKIYTDVESKNGVIRGVQENTKGGEIFYSFLGVPYAKAPVGDLRFKSPEENSNWNHVLVADKMPEVCLQVPLIEHFERNLKIIGSEDCLYLNIYTKDDFIIKGNKPVMVYIHGGGYISGGAKEFGPELLMSQDVVLVIIQYRLNIFGFMSTATDLITGNMGLKDQQMALQWINKNIDSFGGNPELVTLFGQSAGAASVEMQILSPGSKNLFKNAILQSGGTLCPWAMGHNHEELAHKIGQKFNCNSKFNQQYLECIQKINGEELLKFHESLYELPLSPTWAVPRVDGIFLPDKPETLLQEERVNKVNIMTGIVKDEGVLQAIHHLLIPELKERLNNNIDYYFPYLSFSDKADPSVTKQIYEYYIKENKFDMSALEEISQMVGDIHVNTCHDLSAFYYTSMSNIATFIYEFHYKGEHSVLDSFGKDLTKNYIGHIDDLIYLLGGGTLLPFTLKTEDDKQMSQTMLKLWTNFAKYGVPTPSNDDSLSFKWDQSVLPHFERLHLDSNPHMTYYSRHQLADFWKALGWQKIEDLLPHELRRDEL